eukprot:6693312-Pyramimonas_sp.AAC.1
MALSRSTGSQGAAPDFALSNVRSHASGSSGHSKAARAGQDIGRAHWPMSVAQSRGHQSAIVGALFASL